MFHSNQANTKAESGSGNREGPDPDGQFESGTHIAVTWNLEYGIRQLAETQKFSASPFIPLMKSVISRIYSRMGGGHARALQHRTIKQPQGLLKSQAVTNQELGIRQLAETQEFSASPFIPLMKSDLSAFCMRMGGGHACA